MATFKLVLSGINSTNEPAAYALLGCFGVSKCSAIIKNNFIITCDLFESGVDVASLCCELAKQGVSTKNKVTYDK